MARELKIRITGDAAPLKQATDEGISILGDFGGRVSALGVAAGSLLADGIKGGFRAAKGFLTESIGAASDLNETVSKVGVLFGDAAGDVEKFAAGAATSLGQSQQQAMDAAATFATFGSGAGLAGKDLAKFSTDLTGLASDLASFSNTTPEDAIQALGAALRGEAEPIRRYGVLMDDASLRQKALEMGIVSTTKSALTPQQKVLAAQQLILSQTTAAQGDFARTQTGLANSSRVVSAQIKDLKANMGKAFLPIVQAVTSTIATKLLPVLSRLGPIFANELAGGIRAFASAFKAADGDVTSAGFPGFMERVGYWARLAYDQLRIFAVEAGAVAMAIWNQAQPAITWVIDNFDRIRSVLETVVPSLAAGLAAFVAFQKVQQAGTAIAGLVGPLKALGGFFIANPIALGLAAVAAGLVLAYKHSEKFRGAINELKNRFEAVAEVVMSAFKAGGFKAALSEALAGVKGAFIDLGGWLQATALPWLKEKALALAVLLGEWVGAAASYLAAHLPGWLATLGNWIVGTALPWLGEQALAFAQKLGGWIGDAAQYLRDSLPGWIGELTQWVVGTAIPQLIIWGAEFAWKLGGWVMDAIGFLLTDLPILLLKFGAWVVTDALPWMAETAVKLALKLTGGLKDALLGGLDFLGEVASNIVDGLIKGLGDAAGKLFDFVKSFVSEQVWQPVKEFFRLGSPSRLMAEAGMNIAQGLALGMTAGIGTVSAAAQSLAGAAGVNTAGRYDVSSVAGDVSASFQAGPIVVQTFLDGRQVATALAPHQRSLERSKR